MDHTKHHHRPDEQGVVRKDWRGRISVALIYPNHYHVGMSNLGFQTVYRLLNQFEHVVCERAFLPETSRTGATQPLSTLESQRPLAAADILAFSIAFENDYPNLLTLLHQASLPLRAADRGDPHPLVIAGGVACFLNPEPIAPFLDAVLVGEAEQILPAFFEHYDPAIDRQTTLRRLARQVTSVYIPALYQPTYHRNGLLRAFKPLSNVPAKVRRAYLMDLAATDTCSAILTADTSFASTYLIETGRGCPHGCRFCSAGFVYRPARYRPPWLLEQCMQKGVQASRRLGLIGAAVSDVPEIGTLCRRIQQEQLHIAFSSLRADALTSELIEVLRQSKVKTATIAPDAGSERMRAVVNKGLSEDQILDAAEQLVAGGIPNLKLYFMVGLPTETPADVQAVVALVKRIKHRFLRSSRAHGRMGDITVSLNAFVPKAFTPFQWAGMNDVPQLKAKVKTVKDGLKKVANVRVHADVPRWAYLQGLLARGDRKVADLLELAFKHRWNWPQTFKASPLNADFYVLRQRGLGELFPWDFIDHGLRKSFLRREWQRAQQAKPTAPCPLTECSRCGVCPPGPNTV